MSLPLIKSLTQRLIAEAALLTVPAAITYGASVGDPVVCTALAVCDAVVDIIEPSLLDWVASTHAIDAKQYFRNPTYKATVDRQKPMFSRIVDTTKIMNLAIPLLGAWAISSLTNRTATLKSFFVSWIIVQATGFVINIPHLDLNALDTLDI